MQISNITHATGFGRLWHASRENAFIGAFAATLAVMPASSNAQSGFSEFCSMNCAEDAHPSKVGECAMVQLLFCPAPVNVSPGNGSGPLCKVLDEDCNYVCMSRSGGRLDAPIICRNECTVEVPC